MYNYVILGKLSYAFGLLTESIFHVTKGTTNMFFKMKHVRIILKQRSINIYCNPLFSPLIKIDGFKHCQLQHVEILAVSFLKHLLDFSFIAFLSP